MYRVLLLIICLMVGPTAFAQTPPSVAQIKAYQGLHKAAHENDVAEIGRLMEVGADLKMRDQNGRMPTHVAAFASSYDALSALAKAGANMNALENGKYDVVTIAAVKDDPKMVSLAISLGNKADLITSIYDGTALIAAAHLGHHEVVRRLIKGGAPLDHVNNLGWTALIEAVILGDGGADHVATVQALVAAGADPRIADRNGVTPLGHAKARGYGEMVEILQRASK